MFRDLFYTNMNRDLLKKGDLKAVKISREDFKDILYRASNNILNTEEKATESFNEGNLDYWNIVGLDTVEKDLSEIYFSSENKFTSKDITPTIDTSTPNLLGINTLENGLTFLGCMAGGDWEYPLFFIIYFDGKDLRGYVPCYGNPVNLDFKCAFGSENECDNYYDVLETEDYKRFLIKYEQEYEGEDEEYPDYTKCSSHYLRKLGATKEDLKGIVTVNWNAVKEDIINRITIN